jgi:hypothetical protein
MRSPSAARDRLVPTRLLEAPEVAGYRSLWDAAPRDLAEAFGIRHATVGEAHLTSVDALPDSRLLNHALGIEVLTPVTLATVEAFYRLGGGAARIALPEGHRDEALLEAHGYVREYTWVKFVRTPSAAAPVASGLDVRPVAAADALRMGEILTSSFGLPQALASWFGALVGRPGWHALGAYDGRDLVATGSLFVHDRTGWVTWAATDAVHRGRKAQKALLAARIELGRRLGLDRLVVETGAPEPGGPDASYRNILGAGFEPVFARPFWRPRHAAPG